MIAVGTIAVLQVFVSYSAFRFRWVRTFLHGDPIVLMQDGEVIASLEDVQWAVFEPSGMISFIAKKQ